MIATFTAASYAWAPATVRHLFAAAGFGVRGLARCTLGDIAWIYDRGGVSGAGHSAAVSLGHRLEVPRAYWQIPAAPDAHHIRELIKMDAQFCGERLAVENLSPVFVNLARALRCTEWAQLTACPPVLRADVLGLPTMFVSATVDSPLGHQWRTRFYD